MIPVHRATEATFPLGLRGESYFKLYQSDVGLLLPPSIDGGRKRLLARSEDMNLAAVFENAVAQELRAHGHERLLLLQQARGRRGRFHDRRSRRPYVVPIEVKSGKSSRHAALMRCSA